MCLSHIDSAGFLGRSQMYGVRSSKAAYALDLIYVSSIASKFNTLELVMLIATLTALDIQVGLIYLSTSCIAMQDS